MRFTPRILFVASLSGLVCLATGARSDDFPARKAGLWQVTMTMPSMKMPSNETKMCIDAASDAALQKLGMETAGTVCSRKDISRSGSVVTSDSVCSMGNRQITSHAVMTFTGNTAYHTDIKSHIDPPMTAGREDSTMSQDAKWVGPCPADMKPGDILMPNGVKINLIEAKPGAGK